MKGASLIVNMIILFVCMIALVAIGAAATLLTLPDAHQLSRCFTTEMYRVHVCPESNTYVRLKDVSPFMIHALIAAEDTAFYSHKGFDWHEIQESVERDLRTGKVERGGSTLTQQLAKNAFLSKDKSLLRKLKEAYLANAIEHTYKKDFILEKYLNMVEFGKDLYGIKPAAEFYFHKTPAELDPLEAAYLAHLLPNPKVYSGGFRKGQLTSYSKKMIGIILNRMKTFGKLSDSAYSTAMANIGEFPWSQLSIGSFEGKPQFDDFETQGPPPTTADQNDLTIDAESLKELLEESKAVDAQSDQDDFAD